MIYQHRKKVRDHFCCWTPACVLNPPACLSLAIMLRLPYDSQVVFCSEVCDKTPLDFTGSCILENPGISGKKRTQEFFRRHSTLKISEKYLQLPCLLLSDFLKAQVFLKVVVFF